MRKLGMSLIAAGVIILIAIGVKAIKEKKNQTNVETQMAHPIPWYPLIGGILVASGIILLSRKERS